MHPRENESLWKSELQEYSYAYRGNIAQGSVRRLLYNAVFGDSLNGSMWEELEDELFVTAYPLPVRNPLAFVY